jgi:hypothetical protein
MRKIEDMFELAVSKHFVGVYKCTTILFRLYYSSWLDTVFPVCSKKFKFLHVLERPSSDSHETSGSPQR